MRGVPILAASMLTGAIALLGQASQAPVFRAGIALVRVDVTVLDHASRPVPGLTAADFEIMLDGRVQPVQTVDYQAYQATPARQAANPKTRQEVTNVTPVSVPRLVVVLIDDLSIAATDAKDLLHAASQFVASLPQSDLVGFTTTSGEATLNPTRDRAAVEVGLRHAVGQFIDLRSLPPDVVVGMEEAVEIEGGNRALFVSLVERDCLNGRSATARDLDSACADDVARKARSMSTLAQHTTDLQMTSFKAVMSAMRRVRGDKNLVILSAGLLMSNYGLHQASDVSALEHEGAVAGVHVSVLSPEPDFSMTSRTTDEAKVLRNDAQALVRGAENVAGATGGDFYRVIGQPERFFGFVAAAMSGVYHLGVEAPAASSPGREFKLSARVRRPDLTVRANRVAILAVPETQAPIETQLQSAITTGEPRYEVPIALDTVVRPGRAADEIALGANLEVPASVPGPLTVLFSAVDEKGRFWTGTRTLSARTAGADYRLSVSIPVPSGSYTFRVAVADATGQIGSLELPVAARLNLLGPFRTSDVLAAWTEAGSKPQFLSLGTIPATATGLLAALELAPTPGSTVPSGVRVMWTITTEAGQAVAEQMVPAGAAADRLNAQTEISIGSLSPGSYELRATVLIANQAVGVASTTFRRAAKENVRAR